MQWSRRSTAFLAGLQGSGCTEEAAAADTWDQALAYCEGLSWGDHSDWRLPDMYALDSIVDAGRISPAIDTDAFPETPRGLFWSSSSYADDSSYGRSISFGSSKVGSVYKTNVCFIRCVRDGP